MDVPPEFDATEVIEIEDSDSEELELVSVKEDPMNIAHDFGLVVKDGFAFDGDFGFSARYIMRNAANPCFKIDGIWTVGLPLSERGQHDEVVMPCCPGIRFILDAPGPARVPIPSTPLQRDQLALWICQIADPVEPMCRPPFGSCFLRPRVKIPHQTIRRFSGYCVSAESHSTIIGQLPTKGAYV
ncbi:hypothetical protein B0H14DRAFT_2605243 [Mycena olivaceomarginata]|nr:hypothetical protein B0H14DRAFT_2605243 [Mycena olivaceomarginata]